MRLATRKRWMLRRLAGEACLVAMKRSVSVAAEGVGALGDVEAVAS